MDTFRDQMADHLARGGVLRGLRKARHESQEHAAHEIGVSARTVRAWEKGKAIKWENAEAAAAYWGVTPDEIAVRTDKIQAEVEHAMNGTGPTEDQGIYAERLERIEEKLDEILKRLGPAEGEDADGQPAPSPDDPTPPLDPPSEDAPGSTEEDQRRTA